jgi:hypothetical protein
MLYFPYAPNISLNTLRSFLTAKNDFSWPTEPNQDLHFFNRGAIALASFYKAVNKEEQPTIWFPEYFCNESLAILRTDGASINFYPILENLNPNFENIHGLKKGDIFVLTHYFGNWINPEKTNDFCKDNKLVLLHDAAHCIGKSPYHNQMDNVLFSPRKQLAIPNGSLLLTNKEIHIESAPIKNSYPSDLIWLTKKVIQSLFGKFLKNSVKMPDLSLDFCDNSNNVNKDGFLSKWSYNLLHDQDYISKQESIRKKNYLLFKNGLSASTNFKIKTFDQTQTPYFLILELLSDPDDNQLKSIQKEGIPVSRWPNLPPEIHSNESFIISHKLKKRLILVPLHQSLSNKQIIEAIKILKNNLS